MKKVLLIVLCVAFVSSSKTSCPWKPGIQSYTFRKFTFIEALEKTQSLDLHYIETYFGQMLGEGFGDQKMDYKMDKTMQKKALKAAKERNVKIMACGVVTCNTEQEWEQLFQFAKNMGISVITAEPQAGHLNVVEKLADQYKINVAIHNHPQPSEYWNPDVVMKALEGRSRRLGVCADVGHWTRDKLNAVEALEKVGDRLISLHFKDIRALQPGEQLKVIYDQHDVIWGTGICDASALFGVLKKLKFKGLLSIEYEHNWENNVPEIAESLKMMYKCCD